jgi:2-methylcitrate dehydratase PrpD
VSTNGTQLTEYLASLNERNLTEPLTRYATMALMDNLACGLYGARQPWSKMVAELAKSEDSRGRATLFGHTETIAPIHAALANGTAIHAFELDDVLLGALSHPGAVVVPAALAAAQTHGASGARFLLALVAGYETMWRVARALNTAHNHRGFHTTAVAGPIASTVAAAVVMGFDAKRLRSAIGIAGSSAGGLKAFTQGSGGMIKRMHPGRAAEAGVLACELASRGFTGPQHAIDGKYGLLPAFEGESARPALLDQDLGGSFAITHVHVKLWPCCSLLHAAVQALETIRNEHDLEPGRVQSIRMRTSARIIMQNGDPDPHEPMAAQYSLPFCAAAALAADAQDPVTFEPQSLGNARVRDLLNRVELVEDEEINAQYPDHVGSKVEVTLDSGTVLRAEVLDPHGTPADPCTFEEMEKRFGKLTASVKTPAASERILRLVRDMPEEPDLRALSEALHSGDLQPRKPGRQR